MSGTLRWKKDPKATGLSSVGAGPRSHRLRDREGTEYALVCPSGGDWGCPLAGWYWVCVIDGHYMNTCNELSPNEATAKAEAMDFVKKVLKDKELQ